MAKKTSPNEIKSFEERWDNDPATGLPHSGDQVQDFIVAGLRQGVIAHNERYGAAVFDPSTNTMYYFKDKEDRTLWLANNDPSLIVDDLVFNFTGTISQVKIVNKMESNNVYFTTTSDTAEIEFGFISQEKGITDSEWRDVAEDAYITVSVDKGSAGEYVDVVSNKLLLSGQTMKVDVRKFLATGGNRVMVTATGVTSGTSGTLIYTATLTSMYLSPSNFAWYTPFIEGNIYNLGGVNIGGAIDKILHVKMSNEGGYEQKHELDLGTQTYITNAYFFTGLKFPSTGTGVYNVEMWLDANGLESDHLVYSIMCVSEAEQYTAKLVAISEYPQIVTNYSDNTLFKYAVYNAGASTATPHIKVTAVVDTNPIVLKDEDLKDVQTSSALSYNMHLEVETEQSDLQLSAILTFGNEQVRQYAIDNSASYPATSGSVFYLNAANRSNSQANAKNIVNEATKGTVQADWVNMSWTDGIDGWTEDNKGRKCLFMPARTKATIHYQPLAVVGNGKVLEFNFKVDNVADYDEPIITICDDATSKKFRGLVITPSNILLHSRDLNSDDDVQSYDYKDEELVNVLITIIRNYKTNYGNIAQIYVNGVKKCSFEFESADSWATNSNIVIGNNTSDLYLYTMRVYDVAFGFQDAQKNYVGSLYTSKEKADAATKMNSIMDDSYNVDYDLVYGKYNTMVIEMLNGAELPHYGLSKEYSGWCNYEMGFAEHPEWNHSVSNIKIEGQGTTSMNYFRWNLRLRLDKSEGAIITYADGSMSADGALWFDGVGNHPQLNRITAKKNFASSMQSHKMGATEAYNALHHYLELDNEAGGRVAVYQYPAFGFLKTLVDGTTDQYTYTFIGFFTTGPDKGDKATFGYDNADYKSSLIHLEGTDHSIKGVGFDYPWSELKYIASEESLCVDRGSAAPEAAWEVGASGSAKTETAIQAYLDEEFKPAYNLCYENSIMIMGTDESIENINADVNAWGLRKDENGHAYQRYEFWIDGEYDLYYLSRKTGYYEKSGINLLEQCGYDEASFEGLTIEEKNQIFKDIRLAKFTAGFEDYFHKDDVLFCLAFLIIFGATDNFKKNFYPYKFGTLESGSRWRLRQDDLDTLFDIDNQGHAVKGYSIEAFDWTDDTKTAYVFKGESSALVQNTLAAFGPELKAMGKKILGAMYELSDSGTNTLDKLLGFFKKYFWNKAQDYFPKSAYNVDAEYSYEEAWPPYKKGTYVVDVNPLEQSLGDHYEAERAWVERRMIYAMSKFGYGPFVQYNDATLGQVSVRTQLAQNFTITPAMDMYPAILVGQSGVIAADERVKAGEPVTLVGAGGENTNVYIKAADYLTDLGDLSTLTVESGNGIAISSKRLQRIKVGDENPDNVTSNLASLSVGECPSVIVVDARNLTVLSGTVDLTKCPRLDEAYFGGTDVRAINLANGSKITKLQTGDAMTQLSLMNLKFLTEENWDKGELSNVEFFRIEGCDGLNPFKLLKDMYNLEDGALTSIRVVNFTYEGDATDVDMIANLAEDKDKDGNTRAFNGIDAEGNPQPTMLPIVEGNLNIAGSVYEDTATTVRKCFPNLVLNVQGGFYMRFADDAVKDVLLAKGVGDGIGITVADAEKVTSIGTWFNSNTEITSFDEFEKFTGVTFITSSGNNQAINGAFQNCTNLKSIALPTSVTVIGDHSFNGCTSLSSISGVDNVTLIARTAFNGVSIKKFVFPKVEIVYADAFNGSLAEIVILPKLSIMENTSFRSASSLKLLDCGEELEHIKPYSFWKLSTNQMVFICRAATPPTLESNNNMNFCSAIYVPDASVDAYKTATNWATYASKIKPLSEYTE